MATMKADTWADKFKFKDGYLAIHRIHIKKFTEGGIVMANKDLNPEEQKHKVRRRLLKLAVYSVPAIATFMTAKDSRASEQPWTKRINPGQQKQSIRGLS